MLWANLVLVRLTPLWWGCVLFSNLCSRPHLLQHWSTWRLIQVLLGMSSPTDLQWSCVKDWYPQDRSPAIMQNGFMATHHRFLSLASFWIFQWGLKRCHILMVPLFFLNSRNNLMNHLIGFALILRWKRPHLFLLACNVAPTMSTRWRLQAW